MEVLSLGIPTASAETGAARLLSNHGKCGRIVSADEEAADVVLGLLDADREEICEECRKSPHVLCWSLAESGLRNRIRIISVL